MPHRLKYDQAFRETCTLRDGSEVELRTPDPGDAAMLARGFESLSPESKYRRFFGARRTLSPRELRYLTDVDMVDHVAIGAVRRDANGAEEGLGMARFVRDADDPGLAEPAIAVVDPMQGKGLGTVLLRHLAEAARERGVARFQCDVLANNEPMHQLLRDLHPDLSFECTAPGVHSVTVPLDTATTPRTDQAGPLQRLLGQVAAEVLSVPLGRRLFAHLRDRGARQDAPE